MSNPIYTAGPRIELQRFSNYRTLYPVHRKGVLFCFVGMRTGWGRDWQLYPLQLGGFSKERAEEFQPNQERAKASHGADKGLKGVLDYMNKTSQSVMDSQLGEHFKDANEIRAIEADRNQSRHKHVKTAAANLKHGKAEAERKRDALQGILNRTSISLTQAERSYLAEAIEIFDKEAASYSRTLEKLQTENTDVIID